MTAVPRLVTLPASHAYVDAVVPPGVEHLDTRAGAASPWAPDPLWDPGVWAAAATDVDVVHVHFGFDHVAPDALREWVDVTRSYRVRLVLTVHDLRSPHQPDPALLDAQLAVLVPAADTVLTLTPGAAAVLRDRHGRDDVLVVEHPAIFPGPADVGREPDLVGVHLKSFRANLGEGVLPAVQAVAEGAARAGGRLRVDVHDDAVGHPEFAPVRDALVRHSNVALCIHPRFDDEQLRRYLSRLAVSVQLHRWGTHSGWVEACHDVGTAVVAPDVGFLREQWPAVRSVPTSGDTGPDPEALAAAVAASLSAPPPAPADRGRRARQLAQVREVHRRVYAR